MSTTKKILFSIFVVPFGIFPWLCATLIPLIDRYVPPAAPAYTFQDIGINTFKFLWGIMLIYVGALTLPMVWFPYVLLRNFGKKVPFISWIPVCALVLAGLMRVCFVVTRHIKDYFIFGNHEIKWNIFFLLSGVAMALIPFKLLDFSPEVNNEVK